MGDATKHVELLDITPCPSTSKIRKDRPSTPK